MGQKRIMTPTSRLAETAVGVREVSKKIGRARVKLETPKTVMIVTKPGDEFVDEKLKDTPKFKYPSFLKSAKLGYDYSKSLKFWTSDLCAQEAHLFDFAITLGGDGTVLFTSWLFQRIVPPILPFSAGSLGFLTPFATGGYQQVLDTILDHGVRVNLRMRFSCTIYRCLEQRAVDKSKKKKRKSTRSKRGLPKSGQVLAEDSEDDSDDGKRTLPTVLTAPTETFEILNDLGKFVLPDWTSVEKIDNSETNDTHSLFLYAVLDRGPSANLSLLELFGDEQHLTTVQADGIVISTPTGSTAYSLAAGGPLTHPEIPSILISPICPHTLSFRPMLLPDTMELRICVPFDSRSTAWASFDGRGRVELKQGDHIKVTASVFPFPTICSSTQSSDWFHSLSRCLRWNERERQKGFRVVEHGRPRRNRQPSSTSLSPPAKPASALADMTLQSVHVNGQGYDSNGVKDHLQSSHHSHSYHHDHSSGSGTSTSHTSRHGSHSHDSVHYGIASANSSSTSVRARQPSSRSGHGSPAVRKGSPSNEYFDHSPQDTDTMLTCWGTDSSESEDDDEDDSDSDRAEEKDDADDGDGEWEESASSDDDDDDYEGRGSHSPTEVSLGGSIPGRLITPEPSQVDSPLLQRDLASARDEARTPTGRDIPDLVSKFNETLGCSAIA
ncbi:hypothetical protein BG006_007023 [Podila minutissima]|uniref:ATP-NAD kinase n=1 Tax=Podila minutissima TaxID=64525 RepID=A0A9P5VKY7_9FUNG|nr:hypothetical protein BG006_007023 [Podila minutissima]